MQTPALQLVPEGQTLPQVPQFASVLRLVSHPFNGSLSQSPKPSLQAATTQLPPVQAIVAFGAEQTWPQLPQLLGSVSVSTGLQVPDSQQLPASQSKSPAHVVRHVPF